jgi:hypothetical protein
MEGTNPLSKDVEQGKPFPYPVEPQARPSAYAHRIDRGQPLPISLECNSSSSLCVLLYELVDDVSTSAQSIHWSRSWLLP